MRGNPAAEVHADGPSFSAAAVVEEVVKEDSEFAEPRGATQMPVLQDSRPAVMPNSALARIIISSSVRTYQPTSRRMAARFRIG